MENSNIIFEIRHTVNLDENVNFSLIDKNFENKATLVIKDALLTIYFEDPDQPEKEFGQDYQKMLDYAYSNGWTFVKLTEGNRRWESYQPNPKSKNVGDCTLRCYCSAFGIDWNEAFDIASQFAKERCVLIPNVADPVLKDYFGCTVDPKYNKKSTKKEDRITINEFAMTHPYGTYILMVRNHIVTCKNGFYYDSWDSGDKKVDTVYLPPRK